MVQINLEESILLLGSIVVILLFLVIFLATVNQHGN